MLGLENKKQIITVVSSNVVGIYFHHKLCLLALHLNHLHQTTKEKQIASKMVGTLPLVKTIGHHWKQPKNLSPTYFFPTCNHRFKF
jgi:hypothetical protein